tara:strand:- start:300 stop:485 length:186 start_codon:yes stop_codon:yes gene_type:complete
MKTIKNNYTNFILTVIAVAMIGIIVLNFNLVSPANAEWDSLSDGILRDMVSAIRGIHLVCN